MPGFGPRFPAVLDVVFFVVVVFLGVVLAVVVLFLDPAGRPRFFGAVLAAAGFDLVGFGAGFAAGASTDFSNLALDFKPSAFSRTLAVAALALP